MLVDGTNYAFLYVSEFVQLEPDKLIDVGTELYSLAGNKIGNVCHSGFECDGIYRQSAGFRCATVMNGKASSLTLHTIRHIHNLGTEMSESG